MQARVRQGHGPGLDSQPSLRRRNNVLADGGGEGGLDPGLEIACQRDYRHTIPLI